MSEPVVVEILGERWRLPDPALRGRWARCLGPGSDGREIPDSSSPYAWTSRATVASIEARAGQWLMFHAAGVALDDGSIAALVGPSGTGKSTAARTLCQNDFGYVTDETVALKADETVAPFAKPIAVVPSGGGIKLELGPDELGLRCCPEELRLEALVRLERDESCEGPDVQVLDLLEGMISVIPEMSALPQLTAPLAWLAATIERCGGVHRVRYREAHQLREPVMEALAARPRPSTFIHHPAGQVEEGLPAERVLRARYTDAIEMDGEVLLLQGSTCLLLTGIGGLIWLAAEASPALAEIVEYVVAAVGGHPRAPELVAGVISALVASGALVSGSAS